MKFACLLISPMLCDFTLFYRQMTHYIDYAPFLTPDSEKVRPKFINSERTKLMMQLQLAERLRQDVENLAGTKKQHGTVRIAKLAKPFRPTNPPRKYKDMIISVIWDLSYTKIKILFSAKIILLIFYISIRYIIPYIIRYIKNYFPPKSLYFILYFHTVYYTVYHTVYKKIFSRQNHFNLFFIFSYGILYRISYGI